MLRRNLRRRGRVGTATRAVRSAPMHEIAILFAQVAVVVVSTVAALAGIALGTRALWRLTTRVNPRDSLAVSLSDFRRLEAAVDAIAVEVERISEAQRFSAVLL